MTVWNAVLWGALSSGSLFLGQWLAGPFATRRRATGLIMGFGAGTLISAVAYELVPESSFEEGGAVGVAFLLGALTYFVADRVVDRQGGADRTAIDGGDGDGSGVSMFVGALLDGLPEAFVLGISLALGGSISIAFVTAISVSNIPQGLAGTTSMVKAGYTNRHVFLMWLGLTLVSAVVAALGFGLADWVPHQGLHIEAFAAGAVLTMLANSMMPEAYEEGGTGVGLLTVLGFLVAAQLTAVQ